jgi:DNA mismatch repair protein MutS2
LEKYNKQAKILRIEKNKVFVDMEGLKVFIDKKELVGKKITKLNDEKQIIVNDKVVKNRQSEIVLVGKTVEEAEEILDSFIDTQVLAGIDKISIIHGRGSGALRQGIHKYLKNDKRVKSFRLADLKEGGPAITIVNL